jgi:hypothetical protein
MSFGPKEAREWIESLIGKEGRVIKDAPISFFIVLAIFGYGIYRYIDSSYAGQLALKGEQITLRDNQIKFKDDQLKFKDDQISEYRERLHELPPAQSVYTRMTNAELQKKTLTVVQKLRQFIEKSQYPIFRASYPPNATEEEKSRIWQEETQREITASQNFLIAYNKQFKDDVLLLYEELRSRLAPKENDKDQTFFYEHPNGIGMEMAASDLERLAKSLPITGNSN